ncbi:hypothetical protein CHLNCDRAFT_35389 [Chlorella variabilis]|uniref:MHD domain-containing protein n=1 Tax=Chlorella variabilis TaxID=554065 RepID=E1ZF75_CHLVA|nr:hypothetical protein CHLNCDRAFT_35389 [Chlorella variabilis]EFN55621.1 hypothetical protein CHLNCDRAFT_35389 [Chlorella variabilis]|eukprot:XP_005847723.1 hypothetical protein CHLNCDRAFT_35389 [Chlorella variabilis]
MAGPLAVCNESLGALYFINGRGDVLIQRIYRDDIERNLASAFRSHVINSRETDAASLAPVRQFGDASYVYLRAGNVYLLAITKRNSNALMIMQFLSRLVDLVRAYCQGEFSEDVVKGNFVLIYELLDEVLDHGYPQPRLLLLLLVVVLQGWVTPATKKKREAEAANATLQVTGAVGWRKEGLRYKKNEVFLDVIENVDMLMSAQAGRPLVLRCEVQGRLVMKAFLSGMPDIKLGLNDKLEDVTFHPCVNLGRFNAEKVVSFVPPDGEFELMKYRCTEGITLPFKAVALIQEHGRTRLDVTVKVKSTFPVKLFATNMVVLVPVPDQTARASFNITAGKAKYDPKRHALVWKLKKFPGETEHTLAASVELIATTRDKKPWSRPPLSMSFQVPMHSASGVRVQYLKVWEKSSYKVDKWVRRLLRANPGDYEVRL